MSWRIEFTKIAAKQVRGLDPSVQKRIKHAIEEKLQTNPDFYLIGLIGELSDLYKFRVGDYGTVANPLLQKIFRQFVFWRRSGYRHP